MKKILFMLTAMAAFLLTGCEEETKQKHVDDFTLGVAYNLNILPGHGNDTSVKACEAELSELDEYNHLNQAEINSKVKGLQAEVENIVRKYDNGYLEGTITIEQVETYGSGKKVIAQYTLHLQKEAYKYDTSNLKGMSKTDLLVAITEAIKTLDGKKNLTDKEVTAAFSGIYKADAYPYLCGNFDVSKTTDGGKTFTSVKEASFTVPQKAIFYYVLPRGGSYSCYRKLSTNMRDEMCNAVFKCTSNKEAFDALQNSAKKYDNRFSSHNLILLASTDAFDSGVSVSRDSINNVQLTARSPLYGWTLNSRDDELYTALTDAQFDIESSGLCYGATPDKFIEFVKDICRKYPTYSGTLTIQQSSDGGKTKEEVEKITLPLK